MSRLIQLKASLLFDAGGSAEREFTTSALNLLNMETQLSTFAWIAFTEMVQLKLY
jgi:hypothetical protein